MPNSKIPPLFSNLLPSSNLPQPPQSTSTGPGVVYTKRRQDLRYVNKTPYPHHTPAASPPFYSVPALFPTVDGEAAFLSSKCVPSMGKTNLHNRCRALLPQQWTKTFLQHSQRCNLLSLSATTQREAPFTWPSHSYPQSPILDFASWIQMRETGLQAMPYLFCLLLHFTSWRQAASKQSIQPSSFTRANTVLSQTVTLWEQTRASTCSSGCVVTVMASSSCHCLASKWGQNPFPHSFQNDQVFLSSFSSDTHFNRCILPWLLSLLSVSCSPFWSFVLPFRLDAREAKLLLYTLLSFSRTTRTTRYPSYPLRFLWLHSITRNCTSRINHFSLVIWSG